MFRVEVFTDTDVFEAYQEMLTQLPGLTEAAIKILMRRSRARIRAQLVEPGPVTAEPYVWSLNPAANARARAWYFANKVPKGSKGGRYKRTGQLLESIRVETLKEARGTDLIAITTTAPGADYVIGDRQIWGHQVTGWPSLPEIALDESTRVTNEMIDLWFTITDPYAGVPR